MRGIARNVQWLVRPQFLAGFTLLCLVVWGMGLHGRPQPLPAITVAPSQVKGAIAPAFAARQSPDCAVVACLALTFDDGPDRRITPQVLDTLQRQQVRATFFLIGREVPGKEDIVRRMHAEGHEIGNHSYNHADFTKLTPEAMQAELQSTQQVIAGAGVPVPRIFRPPYGAVTPAVRAHVGLPMIRWDIDTDDWLSKDPAKITEHLIHDTHPGGIILMHDKYHATLDALEPAIQALKQHYQFVTISELQGLSAGDQGQFFGRTP
ncbi:MAG TPA: polysaccharide deacetylase family protein [Candidatus Saccharimonadales bacterium]|nr:polysaccharide deacetylase family protein [Candidatus Saccharimonadales bacterium]